MPNVSGACSKLVDFRTHCSQRHNLHTGLCRRASSRVCNYNSVCSSKLELPPTLCLALLDRPSRMGAQLHCVHDVAFVAVCGADFSSICTAFYRELDPETHTRIRDPMCTLYGLAEHLRKSLVLIRFLTSQGLHGCRRASRAM